MSQYVGKEQHGNWWMHCNGTLQKTPNDINLSKGFIYKSQHVIKTWDVRCELDWYRMMKEYHELREGTIPDLVA